MKVGRYYSLGRCYFDLQSDLSAIRVVSRVFFITLDCIGKTLTTAAAAAAGSSVRVDHPQPQVHPFARAALDACSLRLNANDTSNIVLLVTDGITRLSCK